MLATARSLPGFFLTKMNIPMINPMVGNMNIKIIYKNERKYSLKE